MSGFLNLRRPAAVAVPENSEIKTSPTHTIAVRCKCGEVAAVVHQDGETANQYGRIKFYVWIIFRVAHLIRQSYIYKSRLKFGGSQ